MEYSANNRPRACFEILKIIEVSTVEGNSKNYKVEWAPTWVSGAHLLGCDHLIDEFLQQEHQSDSPNSNVQYNTQYGEEGPNDFLDVLKEEGMEQYVECNNKDPNDNLYPRNLVHDDGGNNLSRENLDPVLCSNGGTCSNSPNVSMTVPTEAMMVPTEAMAVSTEAMTVPTEAMPGEFNRMNDLDIDVAEKKRYISSENLVNKNNYDETTVAVLVKCEDVQPIELDSIITSEIYESHQPQQNFNNASSFSKNSNMTVAAKLPAGGQLFNSSLLEDPCIASSVLTSSFEDPCTENYIITSFEDPCSANSVMTYDNPRTIIPRRSSNKSQGLGSLTEKQGPSREKNEDVTLSISHDLNDHLAAQGSPKKFSCEICRKEFKSKSKLNKHRMIHTGMKGFPCEICFKQFSLKSTLKTHKKIHTGQKNFQCDVCLKRFAEKCNLKTHMNIHTGQKFYCDVCSKGFSRKDTVKQHMAIHTGEYKFQCDVCYKGFFQKGDLTKHMNIH